MKNDSINFLTTSGEIYHRKGIWKHLPLWLFKLSMKFRKPDEVHEYKQPEFTLTVAGIKKDIETMYNLDNEAQWKPSEIIYYEADSESSLGFYKIVKKREV